ncbi:natural killer cells antigen CD94-like, partial [Hypanus sabinus]|uniref:natural killer cells antigen CD94-like n=1 Tax=Hypanus sabinus TaxID=79690 RepID=UPI0028C3CA8E
DMGSERPARRDVSDSSIWLICVLTATLVITGICWRIHEQTCSEDWVTNGDRCYYASKFETSFRQAIQECSNRDSRLLEVNTRDEANFVSHRVLYLQRAFWIGKCELRNVSLGLLLNVSPGQSVCMYCEPYGRGLPCDRVHRFICEKSALLFPDIPEKIQDLCQQST